MKHLLVSVAALVVAIGMAASLRAEYPKPSPYPITWELKFEHGTPRRVVVAAPGSAVPQAFWYMTYTVTNNSDKEQMFLPNVELLTEDGRVFRSDIGVSPKVFDAIKAREKRPYLEDHLKIAGQIRIGEDQARDGVAIWPEPTTRLGNFSIFVGGLSGEAVIVKDDKGDPMKDADGKSIVVRKTLQLNFKTRGDEFYPGEDPVVEEAKQWVMR